MQLPENLYTSLSSLADQGNTLLDQDQPKEAIRIWREALALLPEPADQWQAAFWLYASMGEAYYQLAAFNEAITMFNQAASYPEAGDNPYPYYMLGKCYWHLKHERAPELLLKAYDLDGEGIFSADLADGDNCLQYLYDRGLL